MNRAAAVALTLLVALSPGPAARQPAAIAGAALPRWTPGTLDIHQITTGRGNAAFTMFPDGTTMLVDAGDAGDTPHAEPRPDGSRTPGQWITRYVQHMLDGREARLDYAVLTHFIPTTWAASPAASPFRHSATTG